MLLGIMSMDRLVKEIPNQGREIPVYMYMYIVY